MVTAAIWFGWWLCFTPISGGDNISNILCIPMKTAKACQLSQFHGEFMGRAIKRDQFCINNETGERK